MTEQDADNEILDYEEQEDDHEAVVDGTGDGTQKKDVKGTYVSIHSSGFRDFLLKPELLRSIVDCGFEHPSEGMYGCCFHVDFSTQIIFLTACEYLVSTFRDLLI